MSMCGVAVVGGVLVGYILTTRGREHLGCMRGRWRVLFNRHLLRIWAFCPRFVEYKPASANVLTPQLMSQIIISGTFDEQFTVL